MHVDDYSFGKITVDGATYRRDVVVKPDGVVPNWWRSQGHHLVLDDLRGIDLEGVTLVVVGTGYFGRMTVGEDVRTHFEVLGLPLTAARSARAVRLFNEAGGGALLAIHLTC